MAIKLRQTPNELSAAVRTLRLMAEGGVSLAPDLATFLHTQIVAHGIEEITAGDPKRVGRRRLTKSFVGSVAIALHQHEAKHADEPFTFFDFQPPLPLSVANEG